jgi:hypothetical protein
MSREHLSDRELLLLVLENQDLILENQDLILENQETQMASTTALTQSVEGLTKIVGEVVSEVNSSEDQGAIDAATAAIETAITDLRAVLPKPVPTVSSISPDTSGTAGGESVVIAGSGLTGATTVEFGAVAASSFTVESDTQITAITPSEEAGSVEVVVSTPGGKSAPVAFTFS